MLLREAVDAGVPIVGVHHGDPVHVHALLGRVLGETHDAGARISSILRAAEKIEHASFLLHVEQVLPQVYKKLAEVGKVGVVVNPPNPHPLILDCGMLQVPDEVIAEHVGQYVDDPEVLVPALRGLTLIDVDRVARLAMLRYGRCTLETSRLTRLALFNSTLGLEPVCTAQPLYWVEASLSDMLDNCARFFTETTPPRLRPRGVLLNGRPGVGKTAGAKYVARQLDAPLYRLNAGGMLSKWHGESDHNLSAALRDAESRSPCVLLIDEVEKLFQPGSDSDVTRRLLGTLLWWLQEHDVPVFTVMTTNDVDAIPSELVRSGRLDRHVYLRAFDLGQGHDYERACQFVRAVVESLADDVVPGLVPAMCSGDVLGAQDVLAELDRWRVLGRAPSHADLEQLALTAVRAWLNNSLTNAT